MDQNTILSNILQEEVLFFYNYIRDYDEKRLIDIVITDDIYTKVLQYDMCDAQKEAVMKAGVMLNSYNGTLIFAPAMNKTTFVVISKKSLSQKESCEIRGTVLHELTHAHDYYDYADFLQISDYNNLFDSKYYSAFFFWTEFHA